MTLYKDIKKWWNTSMDPVKVKQELFYIEVTFYLMLLIILELGVFVLMLGLALIKVAGA